MELAIVCTENLKTPAGYIYHRDGFSFCHYCVDKYDLAMHENDYSPIGEMFSESDYPCHCVSCEALIYEPLTQDGINYVIELLDDNAGRSEVLQCWREAYADLLDGH